MSNSAKLTTLGGIIVLLWAVNGSQGPVAETKPEADSKYMFSDAEYQDDGIVYDVPPDDPPAMDPVDPDAVAEDDEPVIGDDELEDEPVIGDDEEEKPPADTEVEGDEPIIGDDETPVNPDKVTPKTSTSAAAACWGSRRSAGQRTRKGLFPNLRARIQANRAKRRR